MTDMKNMNEDRKSGEASNPLDTIVRQNNRCCCGKYENCDLPFIANGIEHERLGSDDAFCGPVINHRLYRAEDKLNKISAVVNGALYVAKTDMNQGQKVLINGIRFVEVKNFEDVLAAISVLLVA